MEGATPLRSNQYSFFLHKENLLRQRIYAFSIDLFAILALNKVMTLIYMWYLKKFSWPLFRAFSDSPQLVQETEIITLFLLYINYFFVSLYLSQGKTLGKTLIGLKIVDKESPGKIGLTQSFLRSFGYTLCYLGGLVLFTLPFLNRKQKGVPDWLSHTQVISEKQWEQVQEFHSRQLKIQQEKSWGDEINISGHGPEQDEAA